MLTNLTDLDDRDVAKEIDFQNRPTQGVLLTSCSEPLILWDFAVKNSSKQKIDKTTIDCKLAQGATYICACLNIYYVHTSCIHIHIHVYDVHINIYILCIFGDHAYMYPLCLPLVLYLQNVSCEYSICFALPLTYSCVTPAYPVSLPHVSKRYHMYHATYNLLSSIPSKRSTCSLFPKEIRKILYRKKDKTSLNLNLDFQNIILHT